MPADPPRARAMATDLSVWVVAPYLLILPLFAGAGWLSMHAFVVSLLVTGLLFGVTTVGMFSFVAGDNGWWQDKREQIRAVRVVAALQVVAVPLSWFVGRSL